MSVAVDTMILLWAIPDLLLQKVDEKTKENIIRSRILIDMLDEKKETIVVPVVSIAEILVPLSDSARATVVAEFHSRFRCPAFDIQAAAISADLWAYHKSLPKQERYGDRRLLRADIMIIASAKAVGATTF